MEEKTKSTYIGWNYQGPCIVDIDTEGMSLHHIDTLLKFGWSLRKQWDKTATYIMANNIFADENHRNEISSLLVLCSRDIYRITNHVERLSKERECLMPKDIRLFFPISDYFAEIVPTIQSLKKSFALLGDSHAEMRGGIENNLIDLDVTINLLKDISVTYCQLCLIEELREAIEREKLRSQEVVDKQVSDEPQDEPDAEEEGDDED